MAAPEVTESINETALAAEQKTKLVKSLGRFDAVFFIVATIVGLDLIGQAASNGSEAFFWAVVLVALFLIPYGLVMAEVGSRRSRWRAARTSGSSSRWGASGRR